MKIIIQRVLKSSVSVGDTLISSIDKGLMVLLGITHTDDKHDIEYLTNKILKMKLWHDENNKPWNRNLVENNFEVLVVSQFTLYGTLKGNKPDFHNAMDSEKANILYKSFLDELGKKYVADRVKPGAFGQFMHVEIHNDGPVTLEINSEKATEALKQKDAYKEEKKKKVEEDKSEKK